MSINPQELWPWYAAFPQGRARWTLRLATADALRRGIVEKVSREPIRKLLHQGRLRPWRVKKCGVSRRYVSAFVAKMEDMLEVYERPLNLKEPVVCQDEKPVCLHQEISPVENPRSPGEVLKRDYE